MAYVLRIIALHRLQKLLHASTSRSLAEIVRHRNVIGGHNWLCSLNEPTIGICRPLEFNSLRGENLKLAVPRRQTRNVTMPAAATKSKQRARQVAQLLKKEYPAAECALVHDTPFQLLIATIL